MFPCCLCGAQVLLCAVLLSIPIPATASAARCDRYTDTTTRAACQQLYAGLFTSLASAADGTAGLLAADAAETTAAPSGDLSQGQQGSAQPVAQGNAALADVEALTGSYGYPGRHHRQEHDKYDEEPEGREPWYHQHDPHEQYEPSYGEREEDPHPHKQHAYEGRDEGLYSSHKWRDFYPAPHGDYYAPPAPTVPLYLNNPYTSADVSVTPVAGKENATGDLTQDDFARWSECQGCLGLDCYTPVSSDMHVLSNQAACVVGRCLNGERVDRLRVWVLLTAATGSRQCACHMC